MHTVTLSPTSISLSAGGSPVVQTVTISDVPDNPDDVIASQPLTVTIAGTDVTVSTSVTIDYPGDPVPVVTVTAASNEYTVIASTPVKVDATTYTVELTYTPV